MSMWEEVRAIFAPRNKWDWVLYTVAIWEGTSGLVIGALGIHPPRTVVTFVLFVLPALVCYLALAYSSFVRLFHPSSQRFAMWKLFNRTDGVVWPARAMLVGGMIAGLLMSFIVLWGFFFL